FGWLLLGKLAIVHGADAGSSRAARASSRAWAMSGIAYVSSLVVTALMPLPRLGFGDAVLSQLGLPGSGAWVEQPQRAVAAGALYFGMLAWFKWVAAREPAAT